MSHESAFSSPPLIAPERPSVLVRIGHTLFAAAWVLFWILFFRKFAGTNGVAFALAFVSYGILLSVALARQGFRSRSIAQDAPSRARPERLLIVGATGGTGKQLVTAALARGHLVTALVRNPSKLTVDHPRLTVIPGDVLDRTSVDTAMRGQQAVISALGHKRFLYPTRIQSEGTRNILDAMQTHGVQRLVCATALGIGDGAGRLGLYFTLFTIPVVLPFYFWDKCRQERLIAESGVDWVIVRPGMLNNGDRRGRLRHGHDVGNFVSTVGISRADVADFMLDQLQCDRYLRTATAVAW